VNKEKRVVEFYVLCNKLKDVVRTGWLNWGVKRERVESVAEHVFGVQMLAIAMWSEFGYDVDIKKAITMIAVHETEEIFIGDLTPYDPKRADKSKNGHVAVAEIFGKLSNAKEIENLIYEFDERKSPEAKFAYFCDKLECDIQSKIYDEQHCIDMSNQETNPTIGNDRVRELMENGSSFSQLWMTIGKERYHYDDNFAKVSDYAQNEKITF
jgi:putative hydrolase of HD superfamily